MDSAYEEVGRKTKFGVYIPSELARELDELMKSLGIENRSKLLQESLRLFIIENKWSIAKEVVGSINILYNHKIGDSDKELTELQHDFLDVISSAMHIHLDKERCLLIVAVKGSSNRVKELIGRIHSVKGVLLVRSTLMATQ
ncbi:ribbon-helix-helix domain-containing protein [Ignisphaera sp. 4213-co]|uniref:Putative nickel-responsive regulator n=1 Tax=Ignisphaera cupida TaxID=3050454 RepID=A0ABD4Z5M4_9CREN|nr:ribbon-helix-helix domain-containing protein [Ignisphaera sp. 4213-co]MDK6028054.1 ribbon-helix-helix domain-containing protein [Ignisphaera sp. 4213-co]